MPVDKQIPVKAARRVVHVADLMSRDVLTVAEEMTVEELANFLADHDISGAPVENADGDLVGVVTTVDLAAATQEVGMVDDTSNPTFFVRGWEDRLDVEEMRKFHLEGGGGRVSEIMTTSIYSIGEDATAAEAARAMLQAHVHRLLVMRDGKPVGIVSASDLLTLLLDDEEEP